MALTRIIDHDLSRYDGDHLVQQSTKVTVLEALTAARVRRRC